MNLLETYKRLVELKIPVLQTRDVAALFDIKIDHASQLLSRLAASNQIIHLSKGIWIFPSTDLLALPNILTAPFPSYISLQTALYYHGMISQIPSVIYAISLARTKVYKTSIATVSVHHVQPAFFLGYKDISNDGYIKMATPEKALLDIFYLYATKSNLFRTLPELELPKNFKINAMKKMIKEIPSARKRTHTLNHLNHFFDKIK